MSLVCPHPVSFGAHHDSQGVWSTTATVNKDFFTKEDVSCGAQVHAAINGHELRVIVPVEAVVAFRATSITRLCALKTFDVDLIA